MQPYNDMALGLRVWQRWKPFQLRVFRIRAGGMIARYESFWDALVGYIRMVGQVLRCLAAPVPD